MTKAPRSVLLFRAMDGVALSLGFASALLLLASASGATWRALLPLAALWLCYPLSFAPRRVRLWLLPTLAVLNGVLGWLWLPLTGTAHVVYAVVALGIPLLTLPMLSGTHAVTLQLSLLAFQLVASLLSHGQALQPVLVNVGCAQLILFLFYTNLLQLYDQCGADGLAARMLPGNLGMTALASVVVLALANVNAVWSAIKRAVLWLVQALIALLGAFREEEVARSPEAADTGGMEALPSGETAMIWVILEYVAIAVACAAALYLLYRLARALPKLLTRLWALLRGLLARYRGAVTADYVDEQESLDEADESAGDTVLGRLRRRLRRSPDWRALDNRQRVREAYRRLSQRARPKASLTAREALSGPMSAPQLTDAYDRARYSQHAVTDTEAELAREAAQSRPATRERPAR